MDTSSSVNGFTGQNVQTAEQTTQQSNGTYSAPPTYMMSAPGMYTAPVPGFVPPMTMYPPMMTMPYGTDTKTEWQEFSTPDGRKYYYNRVTKITQWEKPQELIDAEKQTLTCDWQEFTTKDGKKYYYNRITRQSQWEMPDEYKEYLEKQLKHQEELEKLSDSVLEKAKIHIEAKPVVDPIVEAAKKKAAAFKSKEEAKKTFKQLLTDYNVQVDWDWPTTMKKIINDERYKALKSVQERRDVFNEYIEEKKIKDREERAAKLKKMKEEFTALLSECKEITFKSTYRKILPLIENDPRFKAIESEDLRMDLFDEYLYELEKKERKASESLRKESMDNFRKLLEKKAEEGEINYKSVWRKVYEKLKGNPAFEKVDKVDRMVVWDNFIRDLQRQEEEQRAKDRIKKKKQEKKNRAAFWNLLLEKQKQGLITVRTHWKDIKPLVKQEEVYKLVRNQPGASPKHLFEDFMEEIDLRYKEDKRRLKSIMSDKGVTIVPTLTFDQFVQQLSNDSRFQSVDKENVKVYFEETLEKFKEKEREKEKKKQKRIEKYKDLLKSIPEIGSASTYQQCKQYLTGHSAYNNIETEEERERIFNEYIQKLKRKEERKKRKREEAEEAEKSKKIKSGDVQQSTQPSQESTSTARSKEEELIELQKRKEQILAKLNKAK